MNLSQKPRRRRLSEQLEDRLLFDADVADFIALDATSCDAEIANPDRPDERAPEIQTISHSTGPAQTDAKPLWGDTTERQRLGKLSPATAPTPNVSLQLPSEAFLNEEFQFTVKFDNTSTTPSDAGFAPYFDLHVPQGIGVNHAAIFGGTLPPIVAGRFNVDGDLVDDGGNPILHPVTGQAVTGTAGDTLLVYQLPFGSFVPEQPDATVLLNATLSKADGASVGTPLDLSAVGFFALGNDPLDNRLTDPPIVGAAVTASVTPTVLQLVKTSDAAEAERSTGPNFPITYTLTLKLAQGETVEQVLVEDVLPHSHVYVPGSLQVNTTGSYSTTEPTAGSPPTPPGNRLAVELGNLTGSGGVDAVISYQAWIDKIDADGKPVLDGSSGDDKTAVNDARVAGVYQSAPLADNDDSTDTTVSQQSLSIQQSVSIVNDTGARGATPGDTLEYVMHLQVSDYFEFADLVLQGTLSDGQRWDDSFQPLFVIREQGLVSSGTFSQTQHSVTKLASGTGATEVRFDLASAISDGVLTGDLFDDAVSDGGTTVEIRFRTAIEEDFTTYFLSGDRSVDAGDPLASSVTVTGRVRDGLSDTQFESDSSGTGVSIVGPAISKSVYAIEGEPDKRNDPIMAGQSITYRLAFSMPTADFENLILTDFLPLPIYKATEVTAFAGGGSSATPPPAGMFSYGPSHTLNQVASATDPPTLAVDGDSNSVRFNFGNFDVVNSDAETIEILFTVTAQDMRFDDGLLLTNQAIATYQLTTTEVRSSNTITQNLAAAPEMTITKGIVSTDGTSPSFTSTPAPTAFASPGDTAIPFTGRITGADLAAHPIDANLRDVDAGDRVKVAIAIENSGGADGFNLTIVDALLPQYAVAASGLNLQVHRGDGTALHFTGDLFTTGIEITDPSAAEGAIRKQTDGGSSGSSVIIISYDLELSEDVEINQTYQTSAEIIAYGAIDGGANHADGLPAGSLADDATITVQNVATHHSILATSEAHTRFTSGNERVAIGEVVRYQMVVEIPEGTLPDLVIRDRLRSGMQYLDDGTATLAFLSDAGISSANGSATLPVGLGDAANSVGSTVTSPTFALPDVNVGSTSSLRTDIDSYNNGTDPQFKLGTLVNRDNDANAEYIVIEFNALVLNHPSAQKNTLLRNDFQLSINPTEQPGRQTLRTSNQANTRVVEPTIDDLTIRVSPPDADAGDKVTFTITFSNDATVSNSDAFEARLTSRLPDQYTLHPGTIRVQNSGGFGTTTDHSNGNHVDIALDQIPSGGRVTVTFDATLERSVQPGEALITPAQLTYTSLPESGTVGNPTGSDLPGGSGSARGERTGTGGVNHHFDNASALLTVFPPTISKSLVSTGIIDTNNGLAETVIGERATYELVVTIPETTMNRAVVVDTLEPGLVFESLDAVAVDSAIVTDRSGPVTPQISGQQVRFDFGNLTNAPNDAAPETITIRYTVRTDNTAGNQGEASGTVLSNAARVTWDLNGVTRSTASAVADVIVIEPELELVYVASPHQVDAGDRVTLDLVVRHTASSDTDAFDVILSEHLPIELQHVSLVSAIHSSAGDLSSLFDLSPRTKTITTIAPAGFDLHKGETLTLRVTGVVSQSVNPAQTLTVNADARWTSMDEATAVERTGEGGVNDYRATRATDLHIIRPLTTKELVGTSITDAGNSTTEAVIGELVQYRIRVQIPESTIDDARIIDTLDPGLEFVSVDSLAVTSGGGATSIITADGVPIGPPATYHASVVGQQLTFDFGQIINPDDDNSEIESMEIVYTARVVNAPVNQQSQTLSNHVQFVWTRGGVSAATAVSSATDVTIIEPQLRLDVTVSDHTPSLNQVIRYATTISHTAGSNATAHDLSFLDTLPAGMKLLGVTVTGAALEFDSSDSGSVALLLDSLPVGQTATIRYDVRITDSHAAITNTLQNDAVVQWTSLPDGLYSGNNSERDGDGGHAGQDDYVAQAHETSTIIHPLVEITQSTIATTPAASGTTGNVDITYELTVTSTGNDPLTQIAIDEDFSTLFGNGFVSVVVPPAVIHTTADRPLTLNTAYDGTSINPSIVDNSAGVFNRVLQGESVTIRFTVEVDPDAPGISVDNGSMIAQAQVRAFGEVSGLAAVDLSDDPDRPTNVELDPIADNEPDDPNIHRIPMLGLTKQIIGSPVPSASGVSGNYDVTYQIRIENNGSTPLEELVLVEDLRDHLGRAFVGIVSAPSVMDGDASDVPKLNAEYSGQGTGTSLIDAAESGRLESGQFLVIRLTIEVDPDAPERRLDSVRDDASGDFETQAVITAKDPATGQMVWDRSDDPTDPTNVDGDPANPDDHSDDDNDPDDPVSLEFVEIGVAKRVTHVQRVGMSSLVTIQIMVENTGTVYLENIELLDDVKSQFGDNFDSVVSAPTIVASSATVDPNLQPGYADNPSQNMFDGSSGRLAPGEQVLVQLVVQVKPTSGQADVHLVNQAMAAGMPVDAAGRPVLNQSNQTIRRVTDWSDSGADPGSNNPNAPGDTGGFDDPTPTSLTYFTFDGFNSFSNPFDVARQYESEFTVIPNRLLSQQIPRLVADPIFSGTARPGARIQATLYDSDGYQIVSASVFADMGGNWMMQFQGLDQEEEVRVEFEEISTAAETFASTGDSFDALGLPHGQTHYHSLQPWTAYDDRYEFNAVYCGSARQSLAKGHRHANRPIGFGG
ncbi:isopeptide-forming domain-containing fimbrial protein [Stieleria sp. ICT_E10.1]|uniref:isopeptide-forming domain-containing fimbrial protein n=1 Tax=Stieleria sedimenti TaxID=2976331 RepID=UPI00217F2BAB|nr:isopeptide-forming domain-containing fimbrial protein [Stieleria sedimenti]MCS7467528.1 isopeptide-forming domain-containing fimbrial protein [Stieleria sedimenti]